MDNKKYMPYAVLPVGGIDYKLRITAGSAIELEKRLGTSIVRAWGKIDSVETQIAILWAALQRYHHGMSFDEAGALYDDYIDGNGSTDELVNVFMEV